MNLNNYDKEWWHFEASVRYLLAVLLLCTGCATQPKVKYVVETTSPDVWAAEPSQAVTVRVEINQ